MAYDEVYGHVQLRNFCRAAMDHSIFSLTTYRVTLCVIPSSMPLPYLALEAVMLHQGPQAGCDLVDLLSLSVVTGGGEKQR